MSEVEPQFIVQLPNGRKSKPTTRAAIQQMCAAGKIPLPANVVCSGKAFCVPVDEFVSDSRLLNRVLSELPDSPKPDGLNPIVELASVFVPRSAGLADNERLPVMPAITFPAGSSQSSGNCGRANKTFGGSELMKQFLKIVAAVTISILLASMLTHQFGYYVWSFTPAGRKYEAEMLKLLDEMNAENAKKGIPPVKVGN